MVEGAIKHLPLTNAELFGRDAELAWLDACRRDRVFVASIVAWGGVGKTSLVTKWLAGMRDDDWRGAQLIFDWSFYRQGTNTGSSDTFFAKALAEFGDPDPLQGSPWDKGERLAKLVRQKRTLLVLDGVEPMQYGPGEQEGQFKDPALQTLVKELASNNNGLLLITSRLRLRDLDGLSGAKVQAKALEHLSAEAGAQLLRARGAKGTEQELREAADEYKGHALALTLLASYLEDVAESEIRRRNEIGPLIYDEREGGHARRVMEAYDPWLGKTERAMLRMLGLFDRPASEGEIAALQADPVVPGLNDSLTGVTGRDWNKAVSKLRRIGLIASEAGNAIDAHPLVRQHFGELFKQDNLDAWREGHRRLYEFLQSVPTRECPETNAEMEPLYKAVVHGCLAGKHQEALSKVWSVRVIHRGRFPTRFKFGAYSSEVATLSAFFDPPWERLARGLHHFSQRFVLSSVIFSLCAVARMREAARLWQLYWEQELARGDWATAGEAANNLSELLQSGGHLRQAIDIARQSVELAGKSKSFWRRKVSQITLAVAYHAMGLREEAATLFMEVERIQKETQPMFPLIHSPHSFGYYDLLLDQGRVAEVRERATQTLQWAISQTWDLDIALEHISLCRMHLISHQCRIGGDLAESTSHIEKAVDGLRRLPTQAWLPHGLLARAELHTYTRAFADARADLDEAMDIATRCGFRLHECDAHLGYARLAIVEGNRAEAREHLEKARKIVEETGYHRRDRDLEQIGNDLDKLPQEAKPATHSNHPLVSPSPTMTKQTTEYVDIAVVVALQEEFREFFALVDSYTPEKDDLLRAYKFQRGPYRLVTTFVGNMGESYATSVTERLIFTYHPQSVVVIGIAAGIHDDLRVGDVHVPVQADQYMQNAKAVSKENSSSEFTIVPGAPAFRADHAWVDAARHLEFEHPSVYRDYLAACTKYLDTLVPDTKTRNKLVTQNLIRSEPLILVDGHVATGPVVGASAAFSESIRNHDRKVQALEMESAAVMLAAQSRNNPVRALAIRGISDYGDERKAALDKIGGGALRKYAMRNAVRLLFALLDAEVLPKNPR